MAVKERVFLFAVAAKSNTLPINVSHIRLRFSDASSPTTTRTSLRQAHLGTICDGVVTCIAAAISSQPVSGSSTSSFAGSSPGACRSPQTFPSKSPTSSTPAVCLASLRSQVSMLLTSPTESSSIPATSPHHAKPCPVPMSATPPSTCVRPKVLAPPNPQTSVALATCPNSAAGIRPLRPNQPLPPVRTSSCPTKVIPGSKQPDEVYEQVPMHEPDLSRQPSRSALKGSKSTGAQTFQQQLEKALNLSQKLAACHPFPTDSSCDTVVSTGLSRSRSGDCGGKVAVKSLPAVPPKPRLR